VSPINRPTVAGLVAAAAAAAVAIGLTAISQSARACPKCKLGAAALTGAQCIVTPNKGAVDATGAILTNDGTVGDDAETNSAQASSAESTGLILSGGVNLTTAYFHRGYLQEDQGVIVQPDLTLGYTFGEPERLAVTPYVGTWNSFHDEHTGSDGDFDAWFESETMVGLVLNHGPIALDLQYKLYSYPSGAMSQVEEVSAKLSADLLQLARHTDKPGDIVLLGWVQLAKEISDRNEPPSSGGTGFDLSGQDLYMELGLEPSFKTTIGHTPVGVALPVVLGTSLDGFYQQEGGSNDFLGYVSAGLVVTVPLPVSEKLGKWYLNTSVTYLHLLADSAKAANSGQENEFIGTIGISFLN
jgi:hypothetical protein